MFKISLIFVVSLLLHSFFGFGQTRMVSGWLKDSNEIPIPYAHVYLNDTIGTVTNDSGLFILNIPYSLEHGKITLSEIGYETKEVDLANWDTSTFIVIHLKQSIRILDEVIISSKRNPNDSAFLILTKVKDRILDNYPKKKYSMRGIYREVSMRDSSFVRLLEGQFLISDPGYSKNADNIRIAKEQLRKTDDLRNLDWRSSLSDWLYSKNGLIYLLKAERIRQNSRVILFMDWLENPETQKDAAKNDIDFIFLSESFLESNDFYIDEVIKTDEDLYYSIKYKKVSNGPAYYKHNIRGEILVNASDWAVLSWNSIHSFNEQEFIQVWEERNPDNIKNYNSTYIYSDLKNRVFQDSLFYVVNFKYNKARDGKYYLQHCKHKTVGAISSVWLTQSFDQQWESGSTVGNIYSSYELSVTNILPYEKIIWKDQIGKGTDLHDLSSVKDDDFWSEVNQTVLTPISKKMMKDLTNSEGLQKRDDIFIN